jgi:hypothetical protein
VLLLLETDFLDKLDDKFFLNDLDEEDESMCIFCFLVIKKQEKLKQIKKIN